MEREKREKLLSSIALKELKTKKEKTLLKEKAKAIKARDKQKEILEEAGSRAKRTTANARVSILWKNVHEIEADIQLLENMIKEI
ncbi:hypothetical protein WESB_0314 [Brachyspira pilosicoli WesB]|uniref:Uncharacterized protein n=1 Tax=Brachyspira pilosicoli WesB TaxID=1161918 RepID=K0JHI3_BRAPL|nr:hypothetical protein [Brachyspira pilosicoli]CCG55785.1 hypothetical protein WESB_0314 [Brachyspira pilosicoli WesB]